MKLVSCMGGVWRLSDRAHRQLLERISSDQEFDLDKLGTFLGHDVENVTDMKAPEAREKLAEIRSQRAAKTLT